MIPRGSHKRKYRPAFEALERKQLLSAGLPTLGAAIVVQAEPQPSSQVHQANLIPCGTGKSIIVVTS